MPVVRDPHVQVEGEWIARLAEWNWYLTLTMRAALVPDAIDGAFRTFCRAAARASGRHLRVAWVRDWADHWHIHALLAEQGHPRVAPLNGAWIQRLWMEAHPRAGFERVERYNGVGACFYLATKRRVRGPFGRSIFPQFDAVCDHRPACRRHPGPGCREMARWKADVATHPDELSKARFRLGTDHLSRPNPFLRALDEIAGQRRGPSTAPRRPAPAR